jgi:hypothetical protein
MNEDERYYLPCPLRKNRARVPAIYCINHKCIHMITEHGKVKCGLAELNNGNKRSPHISKNRLR